MVEITKNTSVESVLAEYPALTKVFIDLGLPCLVCGQPYWGTIADLAEKYSVTVEKLVKKLNKKIQETNEKL